MGDFSVERFGIFVLTSIIYFGPFLMPALLAFLWRPAGEGFRGAAAGMCKWAFVLSSLAIGAIAFYARAAPHWNILAILIFLPMAALYVRWRWVLIAHLVLGAIAGAVLSGYLIQYPFLSLPGDREGAALYGYDQVAERMEALRAEHGAASLAAISYGATSKLAFGAGPDVPVTSLSPVRDAYDEWRDDAALAGKDMIIHDEFGAIGMVAGQFEEMVKLEDFTVTRFGRPTIRYEFYLGRGYKGAPGT